MSIHKNHYKSFAELAGAMGVSNMEQLTPAMVRNRTDDNHFVSYAVI